LNLHAANEKLEAELTLARSMLNDAIEGTPDAALWESAKPPTKQHDLSRPPRDSGIQNRRDRTRARVSTPPGRTRPSGAPRRSDAPRTAVGAEGTETPEKGPPSSR
jgi:hypothetical protein